MTPLLKKPKLLGWERDTTAPTLTTVTFASNNATTTLAKVWDVVTLAFVPSEVINSIVVTIAWKNVTPTQVNPLSYTATYTMVSWDTAWTVPFTIDFKDINWVAWTQVTSWTWTVTFDKTAPTLASAIRTDDTTITVTLSELAKTASITKANAGWFTVFETGTPATTYAVSSIAPWVDNTKVVLTVADVSASDLVWLTVTYTSGWNWTVADLAWNLLATNWTWVVIAAWDVWPTLVSAERLANTTVRVVVSELCDVSSITKANAWWFTVHEIWAPATTYAVSAIAPNWGNYANIDLTVADMTASAAVWVTIKYTAWWNWTVADTLLNPMLTNSTWVNASAWA